MSSELVKQDTAIQESQATPANLLHVIAQAATDPRVDIEKMERLLAMQERLLESQRKTAYVAAMSRLQAKLPQIEKTGRIIVKGVERSRYAPIEDIDLIIRPLLAEEGFAFSFDSESQDGKIFKLSARLSHRDGHSETKYLTLPIDASDYRSSVQSIGSTVSYGKRQLIKMHLNLIERDEDDDGNGGNQPIDDEQVKTLETLIQDSRSDREKFLRFMDVAKLADIQAKHYTKAVQALQTKQQRSR